jgi:hypothetical protein
MCTDWRNVVNGALANSRAIKQVTSPTDGGPPAGVALVTTASKGSDIQSPGSLNERRRIRTRCEMPKAERNDAPQL